MSNAGFDNLKALVVEDNGPMRRLLRSLLSTIGIHEVYEANSGEDAFGKLKERQFDLILSDLSMEPMNGIDLTKQIRLSDESPNPYVPIIMVTAHSERQRVEAARDAGVTEFLAKPVTVQNLMLRIAEIVERPRAFVRCDNYFGPDRRRRANPDYNGPMRRRDDIVANTLEAP